MIELSTKEVSKYL